MFSLSWIKIAVPALIAAAIAYYIFSLKSSIEDLERTNKDLSVQLLESKANEKLKDASISNLKNSIEKSNEALNSIKADNEKLNKEILVWKNKPAEIKYKTQIVEKLIKDTNASNANGEACLLFMDNVSKLNYGDL